MCWSAAEAFTANPHRYALQDCFKTMTSMCRFLGIGAWASVSSAPYVLFPPQPMEISHNDCGSLWTVGVALTGSGVMARTKSLSACSHVGMPTTVNYCAADSPPAKPSHRPSDGGAWQPMGVMTHVAIPPIQRHEPRTPIAIHSSPTGSCVLDFQVNQDMQCELRIESDGSMGGTVIRLHHAEQIHADGSICISNDLGGVEDRTTFVMSSASGVQVFETTFSYFGARFVDVAGWPADSMPTEDSMVCWFIHTALPRPS